MYIPYPSLIKCNPFWHIVTVEIDIRWSATSVSCLAGAWTSIASDADARSERPATVVCNLPGKRVT